MPKLCLPAALAVLLCNLYFSFSAHAQQAPVFKLFFEKTYLHTDRDVYTQGDTLWFKAYLVNAADNKLINTSNNLHVELIDAQAHICGSEVVRLDGGTGKGDFDLNDTVPAGAYRLRAYTNWMRNFGDNFFFEKNITLLQGEQTKPVETGKAITQAATKPTDLKNTSAINNTPQLPSVRFFPEGGSLVEGVGSIVAIKAEDASGTGVKATGVVLSSAGDTVAHFTCDTSGMGLCTLLPIGGQAYKAVAMVNDKTVTANLPAALRDGLSLHIRQSDSLLLVIISGKTTAQPFNCRLLVRHGGVIQASNDLQLSGSQLAVRIPTVDLPQGICAITIYDATGRPHCERLVYIHHPQQTAISLKTDKKDYQSYTPTTLNLNSSPGAALSVAVVGDEISVGQYDDIVSYLMLGSELRGHIDHAARYFDTTNVNRYKQLDLLLLTQGWRDFVWRRMADTAIHISYGTENGIPVSGRVKDEITEKLIPALNVSLYATTAIGQKLFNTRTDSLGRFTIPGLVLYNTGNIRLSAVNDKGDKKGIFHLDTATTPPAIIKLPELTTVQQSIAETSKLKPPPNARVNFKTAVKLKEVKVKARNGLLLRNGGVMTTMGYPDQVFNIKPEDNTYKTLEWFLLQKGKGIQQSSRPWHDIIPTGVEISGYDTSSRSTAIPPLLFVNGQELDMSENGQAEAYRQQYFSMPISKFKSVILKHLVGSFHGFAYKDPTDPSPQHSVDRNQMFDYYLLYLNLAEDALIDNPGRLTANVQGYYEARNFYIPSTANAARNVAYRPTIHWEPMVKTDSAGKASVTYFNTEPSDIKVIVQGVGADGTPLVSTVGYTVK